MTRVYLLGGREFLRESITESVNQRVTPEGLGNIDELQWIDRKEKWCRNRKTVLLNMAGRKGIHFRLLLWVQFTERAVEQTFWISLLSAIQWQSLRVESRLLLKSKDCWTDGWGDGQMTGKIFQLTKWFRAGLITGVNSIPWLAHSLKAWTLRVGMKGIKS